MNEQGKRLIRVWLEDQMTQIIARKQSAAQSGKLFEVAYLEQERDFLDQLWDELKGTQENLIEREGQRAITLYNTWSLLRKQYKPYGRGNCSDD